MKEWLLPASMTMICWGIWGFIPKITTRYINPLSASLFEGLGSTIFALIILVSLNFKPDIHPKGVSLAFVTGLLGMNVGGLPGVENNQGFIGSVVAMAVAAVVLVVFFRWKKWL